MRKAVIIKGIEANLADMVWYNRHQILKEQVDNHDIWLVDKYAGPDTMDKAIWEGALKAAMEIEKKYGVENLEFDDYEWGVINGKLSALRWVLGEEWDALDT